jgi:hypothetical protein
MKNRNNVFITIVSALAFALAPIVQAGQHPDGGPTRQPSNDGPKPDGGPTYAFSTARSNANSDGVNDGQNLPMITIHSTDNVIRGKTGSFVLDMKPALMLGGTYVNFKVSGTAIAGVDYVLLVSPTYIGQSGYGVIQVKTLADPRESSFRQAYSVVVTLEAGPGYGVGASRSATMWIKP